MSLFVFRFQFPLIINTEEQVGFVGARRYQLLGALVETQSVLNSVVFHVELVSRHSIRLIRRRIIFHGLDELVL